LIPYIESRYRALTGRDDRAIIGLSMGGGQALSIGLNRVELLKYVGGFSSGLGSAADFSKSYASLIVHPETANTTVRLLWVGCGTEDGAFAASKGFSDFLNKNRIKHTFRETSGAHTWMVWRRYMHEISALLFQ